ncbi:glutamate--tRNA ligase [Nocardia fluminea]
MLSTDTLRRLIPATASTPDDLERQYPSRELPQGAEVTRFAPSPTGYVHIGGILVALIAQSVAKTSEGVFILRIEDTDRNRFVEGAVEQLFRSLAYFGLDPDESINTGSYGPYAQSERAYIYDTYIDSLLQNGLAYPCFCTSDELSEMSAKQRTEGVPMGYWGKWAKCRHLSESDVVTRLDSGDTPVIRFRAPEFTGKRIKYTDRVRGTLEIEDNRNDVVIRKSMGLPTYHMAHAVDDHLMRVTTVIRADEWLSSVPLHLQLFEALGFDIPRYAHIAPIAMMEGKSKRKLSKRKDPQANVDFYAQSGYPVEGVLSYLRGLANSRLQDRPWREVLSSEIRLEECSVSGQLLDLDKLDSLCRHIIADMTITDTAARLRSWADSYDKPLAAQLDADFDAVIRALSIEESTPGHPRKDLAKWGDFGEKYAFLLPSAFEVVQDSSDDRFSPLSSDSVCQMANAVSKNYQHDLPDTEWFDQIRRAALELGFAPTVGEFKRSPEQFRGPLKDAANTIRVLLTGSTRSPDLYQTSRVLGKSEVLRRLSTLQ